MKFVFVALLIGAALMLPTKVRASGGEYMCNSNYLQAYNELNQWMGQCAYGCTSGGGEPNQYCYTTGYSDCVPNPDGSDYPCFTSNYQNCGMTNNPSCLEDSCVNPYNYQFQQLLNEYCTPD